jgi:hypothetical protein
MHLTFYRVRFFPLPNCNPIDVRECLGQDRGWQLSRVLYAQSLQRNFHFEASFVAAFLNLLLLQFHEGPTHTPVICVAQHFPFMYGPDILTQCNVPMGLPPFACAPSPTTGLPHPRMASTDRPNVAQTPPSTPIVEQKARFASVE